MGFSAVDCFCRTGCGVATILYWTRAFLRVFPQSLARQEAVSGNRFLTGAALRMLQFWPCAISARP